MHFGNAPCARARVRVGAGAGELDRRPERLIPRARESGVIPAYPATRRLDISVANQYNIMN